MCLSERNDNLLPSSAHTKFEPDGVILSLEGFAWCCLFSNTDCNAARI